MTDADHEELLKVLTKSKAKIMLSGYDSDLYNDYLSGWEKQWYRSCREGGTPTREVIWMNYKIMEDREFKQITLFDCGGQTL